MNIESVSQRKSIFLTHTLSPHPDPLPTVRTAPYTVVLLDGFDVPLLDARHVEELEALRAHPHTLRSANGIKANETVVGFVVDLGDERREVLVVLGLWERKG